MRIGFFVLPLLVIGFLWLFVRVAFMIWLFALVGAILFRLTRGFRHHRRHRWAHHFPGDQRVEPLFVGQEKMQDALVPSMGAYPNELVEGRLIPLK